MSNYILRLADGSPLTVGHLHPDAAIGDVVHLAHDPAEIERLQAEHPALGIVVDHVTDNHVSDVDGIQVDCYACTCKYCEYDNAVQQHGEILAETGSSAYMLYGNADDANTIASIEVGPAPRPEDFGIEPTPPAAPAAPVADDDIPF